jgi:ribosomal protein L12E/L44/L45/RPP1/RPP2
MEEQLVTVETYSFLAQAEAAKLQLEGNGITVFLADAETVNMDWLLGNAIGNIKLQVPAAQAERALEVLEEMREKARERRETEKEEDEGEKCLACGAEIPEDQACCPSCGWSYTGEENGAQEAAHQVIGQDDNLTPSNAETMPLRLSPFRAMMKPFFWLWLTPTFLAIIWFAAYFLNWLFGVNKK